MYFSSKDGNNFFDFYFDCYNYVPILTGTWGTRVTQPYGDNKSFFLCKSNVKASVSDTSLNTDNVNAYMTNGWTFFPKNTIMWLLTASVSTNEEKDRTSSVVSPNLDILFKDGNVTVPTSSKSLLRYIGYTFNMHGSVNNWSQRQLSPNSSFYIYCMHL